MEMKDTRSGFGAGLTELGKVNDNIVALCADLTGSLKMGDFSKNHPERFFQVGYNAFTYGKAIGVDEALDYEFFEVGLPFIKWADVSLHHGEWENGRKNKSIKLDWNLTDRLVLGVLVMSDVTDDGVSFTDAVSINIVNHF